jgi:hypothetical protein
MKRAVNGGISSVIALQAQGSRRAAKRVAASTKRIHRIAPELEDAHRGCELIFSAVRPGTNRPCTIRLHAALGRRNTQGCTSAQSRVFRLERCSPATQPTRLLPTPALQFFELALGSLKIQINSFAV